MTDTAAYGPGWMEKEKKCGLCGDTGYRPNGYECDLQVSCSVFRKRSQPAEAENKDMKTLQDILADFDDKYGNDIRQSDLGSQGQYNIEQFITEALKAQYEPCHPDAELSKYDGDKRC